MAYTPLKTWLNGDVVLSADLQGNCDDAKKYLMKLETGALESDPWVDTRHIMKGDYQNINNQAQMVSGVFGGQVHNHSEGLYTYATTYNNKVVDGNSNSYVMDTTLTLELFAPAVLFFQYYANVITTNPDLGVAGPAPQTEWADFGIYVGNKDASTGATHGTRWETRARALLEEDTPAAGHHLYSGTAKKLSRQQVSSFFVWEQSQEGVYNIGLATESNAAKSRLTTWGVSIEAFYL